MGGGVRRMRAAYRLVVGVGKPFLALVGRRVWSGGEYLPRDTGFIAVANHISTLDPLSVGHFLHDNGAPPRFLAKAELFRVPVLGAIFRGADQIPVERGTNRAGNSLEAAQKALEKGECVMIFPEGTLTDDPDLWPMRAKTGVARLALATGKPVVPIAQWGTQDVIPPDKSRLILSRKRRSLHVVAGPAVDLSEYLGKPVTSRVLREVTDLIMGEVTALLSQVRGEQPPAVDNLDEDR